jgi:hypothetical protein
MGEITTAVHVFFDVASTVGVSKAAQLLRSDLSAAAGDDVTDYDDDAINYWGSISAFFDIVPTQYGGMRFMVGAVYTYNGGSGYQSQRNPYSNNLSMMRHRLTDIADAYEEWKGTSQYGPGNRDFLNDKLQNNFGGPHFTFSGFIGFYLDYGYVEITNNGTQEKSHEMVYMGAGGFFGGSVSGGYTWPFVIVFVPAYVNVDAGFNITFFLGSEGDPQKTLDSFYNTDELTGQDFSFTCEIYGKFYGSVTIGVGFYKVLGMAGERRGVLRARLQQQHDRMVPTALWQRLWLCVGGDLRRHAGPDRHLHRRVQGQLAPAPGGRLHVLLPGVPPGHEVHHLCGKQHLKGKGQRLGPDPGQGADRRAAGHDECRGGRERRRSPQQDL